MISLHSDLPIHKFCAASVASIMAPLTPHLDVLVVVSLVLIISRRMMKREWWREREKKKW